MAGLPKTVLITGATDGIGLEVCRSLAKGGHKLLVHGRSASKLSAVQGELSALPGAGTITALEADLSDLSAVQAMIDTVRRSTESLDVIINNAGVLKTPSPQAADGSDVRFTVNTVAPYMIMQRLLPLLPAKGRVINLSSAAQAPVNLKKLAAKTPLSDAMDAYSQSKLALTMYSMYLGQRLASKGPAILAVNPGSFLGTKMVKEGWGMAGNDVSIGADLLVDMAVSDKFAGQTGKYFDNDNGGWGRPHPDAQDAKKCQALIEVLETLMPPEPAAAA